MISFTKINLAQYQTKLSVLTMRLIFHNLNVQFIIFKNINHDNDLSRIFNLKKVQ